MIFDISTLSNGQKLVLYTLIIELGIVFLLILISYAAEIWFKIHRNIQQKKIDNIHRYFENKDLGIAPPHVKDLAFIFGELSQVDAINTQEKRQFVEAYVLAQTRKKIKSKNWMERYYLLQSYQYHMDANDKANLIELLKDKHPIISLNAVRLSHHLPDPEIYQLIINQLKNLDHANRTLYITHLTSTPTLLKVLYDTIATSNDSQIKKICYDIVYHCNQLENFYDLALHDVDHEEKNCQLAAIKVLSHADPKKAKNKLFELLKSNDWLVRNAVIQNLQTIDIPESLEELTLCLNDENYWVRVNAAKDLLHTGDAGRLLLTQYKNSEEAKYKDIAAYFLEINTFKEKL